ncbi:MAG: hypothetical protein HC904_08935 [Blastochloris sp.]|nr:hypothetical protein [Blastochloris sp.]
MNEKWKVSGSERNIPFLDGHRRIHIQKFCLLAVSLAGKANGRSIKGSDIVSFGARLGLLVFPAK